MVLLRINLSSRTRATSKLGSGHMWTLPWPPQENCCLLIDCYSIQASWHPVGREYSPRQMPISSMFSALCEDINLSLQAPRGKKQTNKQTPNLSPPCLNARMTATSSPYPLNVPPWTSQAKGNPQIQWVPWTLNWCRPGGSWRSAVQFLSEQQVQKEKEQTLKIACTHTCRSIQTLEIYS